MTRATSSRTSLKAFAYYDPVSSSWRTSEGTSPEDSETFSGRWPTWGTALAGVSSELPTPERLIAARESSSSLLKTPTSQLGTNGGSQHPDKRKAGGHGPTLADEVEHLLPTPAVNDMGAGKTVEQWDSWTARMRQEHRNGNGHGKSLAIEALRYSAPTLPLSTAGSG